MNRHYEVTPKTIVFGLLILVGIWALIQVRFVVVAIFIALIINLALDPFVAKLKRRGIPRPIGVLLVFSLFLAAIVGLLAYGFTPLVNQTGKFFVNLPQFLNPIFNSLGPLPFAAELKQQLVSQATLLSANVLSIAGAIVSNILYLITVLFLAFYLLLDWENIKTRFMEILGVRSRVRFQQIVEEMEHLLGGWMRGELFLMFVVGAMVYLGLFALGVDYVLPLSVIAGLLEAVPIIGPIISAVPAMLVGFNTSFWMGIWVVGLFTIVQQLENSLIVPNVMGRAVGFSPLLTLLVLFIGGQVFGVVGAVLAIPMTLFLSILAKDLLAWNDSRRAASKEKPPRLTRRFLA